MHKTTVDFDFLSLFKVILNMNTVEEKLSFHLTSTLKSDSIFICFTSSKSVSQAITHLKFKT